MPLCYEMLTLLSEILIQIKNYLQLVFVYTNFSFSVSLFTFHDYSTILHYTLTVEGVIFNLV